MNSDFCLPGPPLPPHPPSRRSGYRSSRHLRPPSPPVYLPHATRSSPPLLLPYLGPCLFHVSFRPTVSTRRPGMYSNQPSSLSSPFPLCVTLSPPAISCFVLCLLFVFGTRHPPALFPGIFESLQPPGHRFIKHVPEEFATQRGQFGCCPFEIISSVVFVFSFQRRIAC